MLTVALFLAGGAVPIHLPYENAPIPLARATLADRDIAGLAPADSGQATLALALSHTGNNIQCRVMSATGSPSIGAASCRLVTAKLRAMATMKRADGSSIIAGKMIVLWQTKIQAAAVTSDYGGATPLNMEYWITNADLAPTRQDSMSYTIDISPLGLVTACHVSQASSDEKLDARVCKAILRKARFLPALDKNKTPVSTKGTGVIKWQQP